ncbi:MAG: SufE family protein [Myxococcales bacterium]|nr:SufE family protein [Myxococcales bacterium]
MHGLPDDSEELIDNFDLFDGWEDRYAYLIDLGRKLPPLDDAHKTDANKVRGCMSQVWFVQREDAEGRLRWDGDSDATIVRGLIAVLQVLYSGTTPDEARAVDVQGIFDRIGLGGHLSANRRNGFFAMVERLRGFAAG